MRKTLAFLFTALAIGWATPSNAAGTVPGFSTTVQFDNSHNVAGGCTLYVIQAGTTSTPQIAYQDTALTLPVPGGSQLNCDANGRLPQFFLADGQIKFRLVDKNGIQIFAQDNLQVIGPSSGSGGGGTVDPTTILATGDFKMQYGTGPITGFVRCNARTIGSATSGATERANADTSALYSFLWNADPNLAVATGRGASAAADFAANKALTLPDCRGRALAGLDDMGNSAASRLTASFWGSLGGCSSASPTTLGVACGSEKNALSSTGQLPQFTPSVSSYNLTAPIQGTPGGATVGSAAMFGTNNTGISITNVGGSITFSAIGSASPTSFGVGSPMILTTIYIKL